MVGTAPTVLHGAAKERVHTGHRLIDTARDGPLPYHGVISRALLDVAPGRSEEWTLAAPFMEDLLNRLARRPTEKPRGVVERLLREVRGAATDVQRLPDAELLTSWLQAALEARVLSFAQSAQAARACLSAGEARGDLWSLREGHTASVWRGVRKGRTVALNVARDRVAGCELEETTAELRRLRAAAPDAVIEVLGSERVPVATAGGPSDVAVTVAPWIENAQELHVVGADDGAGVFLAVDAFEPAMDDRPLQAARGRSLAGTASDRLWEQILSLAVRMSEFTPDGRAVAPEFEINEGDWALVGERPSLVACAVRGDALGLGAWGMKLLLLSAAGHDASRTRIYWNRPAHARGALERALVATPGSPTFEAWLRALEATGPGELSALGAADDRNFAPALHAALAQVSLD
jgi:hypothetical protein